MKGEVLELIGEYLDERLPTFIFTNRISFKTAFQYKIDIYEIQRQILGEQLIKLVFRIFCLILFSETRLERPSDAREFLDVSVTCR